MAMAFFASHTKDRLSRGAQLLARPGFLVMLTKLSGAWAVELVASPAVWLAFRVATPPQEEGLLAAQNKMRMRVLAWACPEFR